MIVNATSLRCTAVPGTSRDLCPHQEAMVHACIDMETKVRDLVNALGNKDKEPDERTIYKCGILDAPVGAGKTFCMLCLCLLKPRALVVVPTHLYYQWIDAIAKFVKPGALRVLEVKDYADTMPLQFVQPKQFWKDHDVILVSSMHFAVTACSLITQGITFSRIIVDEVDSMINMVTSPVKTPLETKSRPLRISKCLGKTSPSTNGRMEPLLGAVQEYTGIIWLVSSSISASKDSNGSIRLGGMEVPHHVVAANAISCDLEFMQNSWNLPPIEEETWEVKEAPVVTDVLARMLSGNTLKALYAEDRRTVLRELVYDQEEGLACPATNMELATLLYAGFNKRADALRALLKTPAAHEHACFYTWSAQLEACENQLSAFTVNSSWPLYPDTPLFYKVHVCLDYIRSKVEPGSRVLIFTEFPRVLDYISDQCLLSSIECVDLEGGNMQAQAKVIQHYSRSSSDVCVMLAHTTLFSCGMNLEMTTHLIIMHALAPKLLSQVVGRGQRPGRTCPLKVIHLLYPHEKQLLHGVGNVTLHHSTEWHSSSPLKSKSGIPRLL